MIAPNRDDASDMPATISRKKFRKLLITAVAVPLLTMLAVSSVLIWQVLRLLHAAEWVEHNDIVIGESNESLKLTLDMETGLRGFLIRGDKIFLQPYNEAIPAIDAASADLHKLVSDNPSQERAMGDIDAARIAWQQWALMQIDARDRQVADYSSLDRGLEGKRQMDHIRMLYKRFVAAENELRDVRSHRARKESVFTLWLVAGLGVFGGTLLALISRRQFLEVSRTYSDALVTAHDLNTSLEARVATRTLEVQQRSDQLREANRELEAFGYSISHDLRAPMRHISGFADLMRSTVKTKLNAEEMENLTVIYDTARLAGRMVDDLLAFSRIGRSQLKLTEIDLNEMVARCKRELEPDLGPAGRSNGTFARCRR